VAQNTIRIANFSGSFADRHTAAREMIDGGPIDVLSGDFLAELTMGYLVSWQKRNPKGGYVGSFFQQAKDVLVDCLEKNIKIVVNAGGLDPQGLVADLEAFAESEGLVAKFAYIEGDNLIDRIDELQGQGEKFTNIDTGQDWSECQRELRTANAYLGAWGIKEALDQGADVVIAPRVTDAALVLGPAAWKFDWKRDDYDALAGALTAGHIIECGPQACGGNYSFFEEVPSFDNIGFPIAEIEADGSFTITKHPGTGGLVSEGTVIAQLLYEVGPPAYANPDVVAHFDTARIEDQGNDRVRVTGVRGSMPPPTHKVCINTFGGYVSTLTMAVGGLDVDAKASIFADAWFKAIGGRQQFDEVSEEIIHSGHRKPRTIEESLSLFRISVKSTDKSKIGRAIAAGEVEVALGTVPGWVSTIATGGVQTKSFVVHWPAMVSSQHIVERVNVAGKTIDVLPTQKVCNEERYYQKIPVAIPMAPAGDPVEMPFGRLFGTRAGDKGGNANLGVWARSSEAYGFLYQFLTVEKLGQLLPDTAEFEIERYELPNILALNFLIKGYLGEGVNASTSMDGMAKSLGEYLRCQPILVPDQLLP